MLNSVEKRYDGQQATVYAFDICKSLIGRFKPTATHLNVVVSVLDANKDSEALQTAGSALLAAMISSDSLKKCLETLKTAPQSAPERVDSLKMLSSMSYISSYAGQIVAAGGLACLIETLEQSTKVLKAQGTSPEAATRNLKGIAGVCKMLASINKQSDAGAEEVLRANGLSQLKEALSVVGKDSAALEACCQALTPLMRREEVAKDAMKMQVVQTACSALTDITNPPPNVALAVINLIQTAAAHSSCVTGLVSSVVADALAICTSKYAPNKIGFYKEVLSTAEVLFSASVRREGAGSALRGCLSALTGVVCEYVNYVDLMPTSVALLSAITVAGQGPDSGVVDAALTIMLEHTDTHPQIAVKAKDVLEELASEADVMKILDSFEGTINSARTNPNRCLRSLAGVNGMAYISRLRPIFDRKDATTVLMKGVCKWVESSIFEQQQKIIRAGAQSIESLAMTGNGDVGTLTAKVAELIQSPALKTLRDKQGADVASNIDNSLSDICTLFERLCGTQRFNDLLIVQNLIEQALRIMRKFPDARKPQCSCITAINSLCSIDKSLHQKVIESGALKTVMAYMAKVHMYLDIQVAGTTLMLNLAKEGDKAVEIMRAADAASLLRSVASVHAKSPVVLRNVQQLLAFLIPDEEIEKAIQAEIRVIDEQLAKGGNLAGLTRALATINSLIMSPEAARVGTRCGLGRVMESIMLKGRTEGISSPSSLVPLDRELALMCKHVTQCKQGVAQLIKHGGVSHLVTLFESLQKAGCTVGTEACLVASHRLIQRDRNQAEIAYKRGWATRLCLYAEEVEKEDDLYCSTVSVIASMKPNKELVNNPVFRSYIGNLCNKMMEDRPNPDSKGPIVDAMDALLYDPSDELVRIIVQSHGLKALLKAQEDLAHDPPRLKRIQRCIDSISKKENLRTLCRNMESSPDAGITRMVKSTKRILKLRADDAECATMALKNLNKVVTAEDKRLLNEYSMVPEVEALMSLHLGNDELMKACGEYLSKIGSDEVAHSLMAKIINLCEHKAPNYVHDVTQLNNKLAVYLLRQFDDESKALILTNECVDALTEMIKSNRTNVPALLSTMNVVKRLARRSRTNPDTAFGIPALKPKMMSQLAKECAEDPNADLHLRKRPAYIAGFQALADILRFAPARSQCVTECQQFKAVEHAYSIISSRTEDPELVQAALDFLAAYSSQPDGAEQLAADYSSKNTRKLPHGGICESVLDLLKKYKHHAGIITAGYEFMGNMGCYTKGLPSSVIKDPMIQGDSSDTKDDPVLFAANLNMHKRLIGTVRDDDIANIACRTNDTYVRLANDQTISEADKISAGVALAAYLAALADNGKMAEAKKANMLNTVLDMWDSHSKDLNANKRLLPALRKAAKNDSDANAKIAKMVPALMDTDYANLMAGDYEGMKETLQLLSAVAAVEGHGRALAEVDGYKKLLAAVDNMQCDLTQQEMDELKAAALSLKQMVEDDQPESLTLKMVLSKWQASAEPLNISESSIVIKYWDFVQNYTEEYSKEPISSLTSEIGSEFVAGCQCYSLLHQVESNSPLCRESSDEPAIFLRAMAKQRSNQAGQLAVVVANDALKWAEAVQAWASSSNAAAITSEVLSRSRKMQDITDKSQVETMVKERLRLVEKLCINRTYYNGTDCMAALIGLWDDFDRGQYSVDLLKQIFRTMRLIVNDHWIGIILKNNVPKRLVAVVLDKTARLDLLPDVLFLVSALAIVKEMRDLLGELGAVEACLDLLNRCLKQQAQMHSQSSGVSGLASPFRGSGAVSQNPGNISDVPPVQTNACLALSSLTFNHVENLRRFIANKGLELNVDTMDRAIAGRSIEYDVANAASLLMCNTCFRRDEMKEAYGKRGACQSVVKTITRYDGSEDQRAFRCLATMFKAIGNLALSQSNVKSFMEGKIDEVFADLYRKSDSLPDDLMSASLRTLSNLCMENTEENMVRFGKCLSPTLYVLAQGQRNSIAMFALAFDVLACLCRLPANAREFLSKDGIKISLRILNSHSDKYLYNNGIRVLGIQTTTPEAVDELIKNGIFDFLTSSISFNAESSQEDVDPELIVLSMRCIRRLIPTAAHASEFVRANGLTEVARFMELHSNELSMCHLECQRVLTNCLALFPPPRPADKRNTANNGGQGKTPATDDWDDIGQEEVPDEGVLSPAESIERPPGPRAWESVGLDAHSINSIITSLWKVLDRPGNLEQHRIVRSSLGLAAYFAAEKIPDTISSYFGANFTNTLQVIFDKAEGNEQIVQTGCYILNNVAYMSEPELYTTIRRDRDMRRSLDLASQKLKGNAKAFCDLTLKLLNEKSADPTRFAIHIQWNYPLDWTMWNVDKYPMGVQDLPEEWKQELRLGGKYKMILNGEREFFGWRASPDLLLFIWREKENGQENRVEIAKISNISKGLASESLRLANERGSPTSKPREYECLTLSAAASEKFPNGLELNIACTTKRARDRMWELMVEWREAAAFGFQ